jgi:hypothetical protein
MYGKATKLPWRNKGKYNLNHIKMAKEHVEIVPIDQLPIPRLIALMREYQPREDIE